MRRCSPRTLLQAIAGPSTFARTSALLPCRFGASSVSSSSTSAFHSSSSTNVRLKPRRTLTKRYPRDQKPRPDLDQIAQPDVGSLAESLARSRPQEVTKRWRRHAPPAALSRIPLADPAMVDPSHKRYGRKRVRLALEDQFDKYRLAGFFPGDKNEAQAVFLESLAKYRSRIRGEVLQVFDRNVNEWRTRDRVAFMLNEMRLRNLDMNPAGSSTKLYRDFSFTQLLQDWPATIEDVSDEAFKAELEKSGTTVLDKSDYGKINKSLYLARAQRDRPYGLLPIRKQVVGYRVYLPNFTVKLMRNYTPPGQAYDPWIATFRMPIQVTKNDLRSYLKSVYGLDVSFIRTDIYYGKITRNRQTGRKERKAGSANNYKRATVGLYEPFHYPDDEQELRSISWYSGRQSSLYDEFKEYIDLTFYVKYMHDRQIKMNHEFFMRGEKTKTIVKRSTIIKEVAEKRREKEAELRAKAGEIAAAREA